MARLIRGGDSTEGPKRFYVDAVIEDECPKCKKTATRDLNNYCLYNPILNGRNDISMFCNDENCERGWTLEVDIWLEFDFEGRKEMS